MKERFAGGARMLPAKYYTSQEIFVEELERIFGARWLFAGHASQLSEPGSYFLFELDRESLIVTRDKESQVRAFHNVCRHRGARICTETRGGFKGGIQCPYHAWTYGLDGALTGAPNMDDVAGFDRADFALNAVSTEVWEGLVFVNFSSAPVPIEEAFAPLDGKFSRWHIPELQSVHRTVYDVEANWKLLFQNYSECYHCPTVHPVLNKLTPYRNSINDLEEGPFLGGPMRMSVEGGSMTMSGRACAAPLGEIAGEDLNLVYYYTLFPNLFLSLHPDYVLIHRAEPLGPARTRIVCEWFFHPQAITEPGFDASGAVEFWDMTNRQDWHLCTLSQQGISSRGYTPGPYADLESQLAAFDREYLRSLGYG
ncbi:MAG: aromatic ring-hydroxylating dioxygenase subunit alpha [Thermoanaerobaculia bacterium]